MPLYIVPKRFALRGFTAQECASKNEPLMDREQCFETDTGRAKFGGNNEPFNNRLYSGWGFANLDSLADGDVMRYDAARGIWVPAEAITTEEVQDIAASMLTGGTHTNVTVAYDDTGGVINLTGGAGGSDPWTWAMRTSDLSRNSTTTFADDPVLTLALAASTTYNIVARCFFDTGATPDFKYQLAYSGTYGAAYFNRRHTLPGATTSNTNVFEAHVSGSLPATGITGTGSGVAWFDFDLVLTTTTSGMLSIQWAQNTSDASNTTMKIGSYIKRRAVRSADCAPAQLKNHPTRILQIPSQKRPAQTTPNVPSTQAVRAACFLEARISQPTA